MVLALAVALVVGTLATVTYLRGSAPSSVADGVARVLHTEPPGPATEADGVLPGGATAYDSRYAGIARLDPALLRALRTASDAAARRGITVRVNSGWRSATYQDQLLHEAVAKYGSTEAAARWVATATTSPHVAGEAVDVGPSAASTWLSRHGARYGLCPIYRNEPWHFELRPDAVAHGCPHPYADPTHDPRLGG